MLHLQGRLFDPRLRVSSLCVEFSMCTLRFPSTSLKHARMWTGDSKLPLGMKKHVYGFVHIVPKWLGVPFRLYSCHVPSVPEIGSRSTVTLQDKTDNDECDSVNSFI